MGVPSKKQILNLICKRHASHNKSKMEKVWEDMRAMCNSLLEQQHPSSKLKVGQLTVQTIHN
jgi:hypothetical protein